ncbi:MAG: hydroxymethylglutaryl-CoA lyase [Acidimicrobiales bacterium]
MSSSSAGVGTTRRRLPERVTIREVGPRDGLQAEAPLPAEARLSLIGALLDAGLRHLEVAAFVSPRAVPAMADSDQVVLGLPARSDTTYTVLVPNRRGAELAPAADEVTFTISASPTYNRRNVGMEVEESLVAAAEVVGHASLRGWPVDAVVSCAFGSPYEGDVDPTEVAALGRRLVSLGVTSLTFADTTGMATPRRVEALLAETGTEIGLHLHETRGTALVNAYAALEAGVERYDTSIGGLGGSPFAAGAAGNLATEDLVHLLDDLGVESGVDLERLLAASRLAAELVGHPVPSRVAAAGPRSRLA